MSLKIATNRLMNEWVELHKSEKELNDMGIYFSCDEDNLFKAKAMIIGPDDTPYARCPFFFTFEFTHKYPFKPPKAVFRTGNGKARLHPNLYVDGKVCLSMLNTWSGPSWSSCNSFRSVLIAIQSIMNDNPITSEPSYEDEKKKKGSKAQKYHDTVQHECYSIALTNQITKVPSGFEEYIHIIKDYVKKNIYWYIELLNNLTSKDGQQEGNVLYGMNITYNYTYILNKLMTYYNSIASDDMHVKIPDYGSGAGGGGGGGAGCDSSDSDTE